MNESAQPFSGRLLVGASMLALGLLWTADNLGLTNASEVLRWWPLLIVAFGVARLAGWGGERRPVLGIFCTVLGCLMVGSEIGWWRAGLGLLWPLAIVALGVQILVRGSRSPLGTGHDSITDGSDYMRMFTMMGSASTRSLSAALRGGELSAVMGSLEVDLREATPADGPVIIDAFAFMGSIDLVVAPDWQVDITASPIMGELQDQRSLTATAAVAGRIVVRGAVILGSLHVTSEPSGRRVIVGVSRIRRRDPETGALRTDVVVTRGPRADGLDATSSAPPPTEPR